MDMEPRGPFRSDEELWDALVKAYSKLPQHILEKSKKQFPKCERYVLTHYDLNLGNVMVRDGKVVSILDWKYAAYFPVWYEYIAASFAFTEMDVEWKNMLRERRGVYHDAHDDARAAWKDLLSLTQYPDLDEKGREVFERLSSA